MTRRDQCYFVGKRARLLNSAQSAQAWTWMAGEIEAMGDRDLPKFRDLIGIIRRATIAGRMIATEIKNLTDSRC